MGQNELFSGPKMQILKTRIFPYPNKKQTKLRQNQKFDLFIKSSFFLTLGKLYYSLSHFFDIGKIIEDEINKSNDPLFSKFEKTQIWKWRNLQLSPWVLELREISRINQNAWKYDMHDDLVYNIPNCKFGMLQRRICLCGE